MLFNSYPFIFIFLPITLAIYFALGSRGMARAAIGWVVAASLFYYAWWDALYLALLSTSLVFNFFVG